MGRSVMRRLARRRIGAAGNWCCGQSRELRSHAQAAPAAAVAAFPAATGRRWVETQDGIALPAARCGPGSTKRLSYGPEGLCCIGSWSSFAYLAAGFFADFLQREP